MIINNTTLPSPVTLMSANVGEERDMTA